MATGRWRWVVAAFGAALVAGSVASGQDRALDGHTFAVTISAVDSAEGESDTLTFAEGQFESAVARRWGFSRTPYEVERKRAGWAWRAAAQSPRGGEIRWNGIVFLDRTISGSFTWSKRGEVVNYTFLGRQR